MFGTAIVVACSLLSAVIVDGYALQQPIHVCVGGCQDWSGYVQWNTTDPTLDYYTELCTDSLRLQAVYACAQEYCTAQEIYAGLDFYNDTCISEAGITIPKFEDLALSRHDLNNLTVLSADDYLAAPYTLDTAALPDQDWIDLSWRTLRAYDSNFWYSYDFTWASYGFWSLVFFISLINRTIESVKHIATRPATVRTNSGGIWTWTRRQLVLPAAFGKHCQEPIGWATLPPRLEFIIIVAYLTMSVVMCFPGYDLFVGNAYWPDIAPQITRYIADRTAVLAIANVPLVWLFAARNDPLLWLTGFSYASFNRFHRWVARLSFVFALVHSIVWTIDYIKFYGVEEYNEAYQETWWWTGVVATIIMSLLLPASVYWLRNKHYDFFLITHILLSVIFLVTLYFHIQVYENLFNGFIWPCVAIWSLDRLLRIVRVVFASVLPRILSGTRAVATYDENSDIIRLEVSKFFAGKKYAPGQYYYVYLPASLKGWESHPFTLCSWNPIEGRVPSLVTDDVEKEPGVSTLAGGDSDAADIRHTFLIRPHAGFTQRLRNKIHSQGFGQGSGEVTVLLEGPYGRTHNLSHYSDVLIVAAGSGIVTAISHAHQLLDNGRTEVHLTWVLPQRRLVEDVCETELASIMKNPRFHMTVYLTDKTQDVEATGFLGNCAVHAGRPDIFAVMQEARTKCRYDLAITTSGTPQVADVCRASVVRLLKEAGPKVDYYAKDTPW